MISARENLVNGGEKEEIECKERAEYENYLRLKAKYEGKSEGDD